MHDTGKILRHIHVKQGDITGEETDAIVNAANPSLLGGGGVDGAIHRAAGPGLLNECRGLGGCRHGEARITGGHNLKARYVIHTPGPIYRGGKDGERNILQSSYHNSMNLAREKGCTSISFPAISTGVYGYPRDEACRVAVDTVIDFMKSEEYLIDVYFVLFDNDNYSRYVKYVKELQDGI
ncbi:MAG: O-acetyl-ADP-ribose deacetylase [Spirochaetae bacterium HGW-Spirochaetae-1]|jgi:O-acetyl-ADP-ribose deacetylase (regulator of RNase III)|nr:MAG: O-acetyl-ADP-ribose deacetylase [Spirochaetae bacterium HGW-Spirochaetae-1]